MPWRVRHRPIKSGNEDWAIEKQEKDGSWHIVGRSTSKDKARASVRARYASKNKK